MDINTSIYGTPESWVSFSTTTDKANLKMPVWGTGSYKNQWYGGFQTGVFTLNEDTIDRTIAPWGINAKAAINNKKYLYVTMRTSGGSFVDLPEPQTRDVYSDNSRPLPAIFAITGADQYAINQYNQYAYNADQLRTNGKLSRPITNFTYNNIVICPQIVCGKVNAAQNAGYDVYTCSIRDYFDNYINTYPVIIRIYIDGYNIYYGQPTVNVTQRIRDTSNAIGHVDTRTTAVYPVVYNNVVSPLRQAMRAVTNNRITIVGMDNSTTPPTIQCPNGGNLDLSSDDAAFAFVSINNTFTYYYADNGKIAPKNHVHSSTNNYLTTVWESPTEEEVLKECAYLGFWFSTSNTSALNSAGGTLCTDDNLYLPKFDDAGITTGEYYHGAEAGAHAPADDVDIRDLQPEYDPNAGGGDVPDEDSGDLGNFRNFTDTTHFNYPCTVYALTETNFRNFAEALNALYLTDEDTTQMELDFKGSNPTDYIINCYALPFEPNFLSSSEVGVQIGPQTLLNITGKVVNTATSFYIDCGSKTIPRRGNFLDFEPYTHIELYLPMCGTVTLDPALVVGKTIRIVMYYNILTNSATAAVYRLSELGDSLIATSTGEIGISIPFSAYNMGQYQNAIKATENAIKQNGLKVATGVATTAVGIAGALLAPETGGLSLALTGAALAGGSSALSAAMKGGELHYELEHIAPSVSQCSSADGSLAHVIAKTIPWLFIKRARMLQSYDEEVYAKTIGHACCINDILGGNEESPRSGLTVCSNIDTSGIQKEVSTGVYIAPTVEEINAIKQAAASGIIL